MRFIGPCYCTGWNQQPDSLFQCSNIASCALVQVIIVQQLQCLCTLWAVIVNSYRMFLLTKPSCVNLVDFSFGLFWTFTALPPHALLHFPVDHTVGILPLKRTVHPPQTDVVVGCDCRVKWSGNRQYDAVVLNMGEDLIQLTSVTACF